MLYNQYTDTDSYVDRCVLKKRSNENNDIGHSSQTY